MSNDTYKTEKLTTAKGNKFKVEVLYDDTGETPWGSCDGRGQVSDWTSRDKKPGEVILCEDRNSKQFYDMQGAIKTARADGWSCEGVLPTDTPGQKAVKAAQSDFNYLKAWCDNDWWYCCLRVVLLDPDGSERDSYDDYLGGVEDGYYMNMEKYAMECAQGVAEEIENRYLEDLNMELISELHQVKDHALFMTGII